MWRRYRLPAAGSWPPHRERSDKGHDIAARGAKPDALKGGVCSRTVIRARTEHRKARDTANVLRDVRIFGRQLRPVVADVQLQTSEPSPPRQSGHKKK